MSKNFIPFINIPDVGSEVLNLHSEPQTWLGPIQISNTACSDTISLATQLADLLTQMGGPISVIQGKVGPGILLGLFSEWSPLFGQPRGTAPSYLTSPTEDYVIITKNKYLKILAKDSISLEKAVWRFAYLIGYRMLAPTNKWEIIPTLTNLKIRFAIAESPPLDFVSSLGSSGGLYSEAQTRIDKWTIRNQLQKPYSYGVGHTWQAIILANEEAFNIHPEYGTNKKLCVLEPAVKEFALQHIINKIERTPQAKVVSLAISDGILGWDSPCLNTHEEQLYNPSDRQILLANYVQEQIDLDPKNRGVRLSIQAYGATSISPTVEINPRLVILITDGYYFDGKNYQDVMNDYKTKGAIDFIPYSYLGIWTWFRGLPGQGKGCNLDRISADAVRAHNSIGELKGAVLESCPAWGAYGLGYWAMAQLLNNKSITDIKKLQKDFIASAFADITKIITTYYNLILTPAPFTEDLLYKLYGCLRTAFDLTKDSKIKDRLIDLGIYVRYLELYKIWKTSQTIESFDQLVSHIWRAKEYDIIAARLSYYDPTWDSWYAKLENLHPGFTFTAYSPKPWLNQNDPFVEQEINAFIDNGLISNQPLNFLPKGFSDELIYQDRPQDKRPRANFVYSLEDHSWSLWMKKNQTALTITLKGGKANNTHGNGSFNIMDYTTNDLILSIPILIDQETTHTIELPGDTLYRVDIESNGGVDFSWPPGYCFTLLTSANSSPFAAGYSGYFFIPAKTNMIGGYSNKIGTRILNPAGDVIYTTKESSNYFNFKIPISNEDQIFRVENMGGAFTMLTTPPGLAFHPNELLIPKS